MIELSEFIKKELGEPNGLQSLVRGFIKQVEERPGDLEDLVATFIENVEYLNLALAEGRPGRSKGLFI